MADKTADKMADKKIETISEPEEEIVALAEVTIPDFPTPYFHASNHDGTRNAVKMSELKDYINSMK